MAYQQKTEYVLGRNHSNALPRYIIAYDTETMPEDIGHGKRMFSHRFRLGVAITCRLKGIDPVCEKIHYIFSPNDFWKLVNKFSASNYTTWVVCHNALFDMIISGMPEQFECGNLVIEWPRSDRKREDNDEDNVHARTICVIDSPPTIIAAKYVPTGGRIVIVDTLNWFPTSLARMGVACGIAKTAMPDFSSGDEEWRNYCYNDARIVFESFIKLIKWVREMDMGMFRYTAPAQAMSAYRHRFMKYPIYIHDNTEIKALERRGFFAGRTEIFKSGKITQQVHQLDISSLFPSVMQFNDFPSKLNQFTFCDNYITPPCNIDHSHCIAEVEINTRINLYPLRTESRIIYPIGIFRTVLCGPELSLASDLGHISKVRSWAEYTTEPIFHNWVAELWSLRQRYKAEGNLLYDEFTKRLMNSLYGKFGQRSAIWINVSDEIAGVPWSKWIETDYVSGVSNLYRSFGWQVQKHCDKAEMSGTFVAISAFVASAARMRMNSLRTVAGVRNVYYQGVDSLIVTDDGLHNLIDAEQVDDNTLGKLRLQLSTNHGEIIGHSDYVLGDKHVIAGRAAIHEVFESGEIMQRIFSPEKKLFSGAAIDTIEEEWRTWKRSLTQNKGTVTQDGWVDPFVIGTPDN